MSKVFVFGFDLDEAAQARRIRSVRAAGFEIVSATMRRSNLDAGDPPDWENIHLGDVENERLLRRVASVARAIVRMATPDSRAELASADVILARNFDMAAIALASRALAGRRDLPLIYECLDIHSLFTRTDLIGAMMRWCERRLLARTSLLLVSSPGFIDGYFRPVQGYDGAVVVLENKIWFDGPEGLRPRKIAKQPSCPRVLGWVGSIRCAPSLEILMATADALGSAVMIEIHGNIHRHAIPNFDTEIARLPNVVYRGPYRYPQDLAAVYAGCDLVWAQDLWQRGGNSDWLLPNRIYEASWYGCPSIAVADTETGRRVASHRLGFTIPRPNSVELVALLSNLADVEISDVAADLLARDPLCFRLTTEEVRSAIAVATAPRRLDSVASRDVGRTSAGRRAQTR